LSVLADCSFDPGWGYFIGRKRGSRGTWDDAIVAASARDNDLLLILAADTERINC
jgi:hypothetical protein